MVMNSSKNSPTRALEKREKKIQFPTEMRNVEDLTDDLLHSECKHHEIEIDGKNRATLERECRFARSGDSKIDTVVIPPSDVSLQWKSCATGG